MRSRGDLGGVAGGELAGGARLLDRLVAVAGAELGEDELGEVGVVAGVDAGVEDAAPDEVALGFGELAVGAVGGPAARVAFADFPGRGVQRETPGGTGWAGKTWPQSAQTGRST
jgi:hypothetical protein